MLRFNLNISILLNEYPFLERFDRAARLGFTAVEFWWPPDEDLMAIAQRIRDTCLAVTLFNFDAGDIAGGERGLLNDPQRQQMFREHVPVALEFAQMIGCTQINALVGTWRTGEEPATQLARVHENLLWAADRAREGGVTLLLEALNHHENGAYMLTTTRDTLHWLDTLRHSQLGWQYDIYHMQRVEGNILATIRQYAYRMRHIQIADAPDRHQPGTGELNYPHILQAISESGYTGSVGLEYRPLGTSEESLAWVFDWDSKLQSQL